MHSSFHRFLFFSSVVFSLGAFCFPEVADAQESANTDAIAAVTAETAKTSAVASAGETAPQTLENFALLSESAFEQVTSVSQLTDVRPTDWAFQALQSLVERYGCIVGYPDRTYRGNQALTRYEFAAGLNACLDRINELIAAATGDLVKREDLDAIRKLQEEFAAELATLRGRVDSLEARTTTLEKQQFSTTTKLRGEAIFAVADTFGDSTRFPNAGGRDNTNVTLGYRARLNFESSFTGKDQLRIRLQGRNLIPLSGSALTGTNMTRLSFDGNSNSNVELDDLYYRFQLTDSTRAWLVLNGYGSENFASTLNPFLESDGSGAVSRFGRYTPLYRTVRGPGVAVQQKFGDNLSLSLAYRAQEANDPAEKRGLFDGNHGVMAQLTFSPSKAFSVAAIYTRSYFRSGNINVTDSTGSAFATQPFGGGTATLTNSIGGMAQFQVSPKFFVSGWVGYTAADAKSGANSGADASIWNWAVTLAFPDLGGRGNLGGIIVGMPPKVTSNDIAARENRNTSIHLEGLYRYRLNSNIAITPGVIVIFNPEHDRRNDTQFVGVVRTTFSF